MNLEERQSIMEQRKTLLRGGASKRMAAEELGISYTTLYRWERRLKERGVAGLVPGKSTGRPRKK